MADQVDSTSTASAMPNSDLPQQASLIRKFLELVRFSHTVFALPFALLGCVWAYVLPGMPELSSWQCIARITGVLICMVTARSAAMAFNRLVDRQLDAENPRTESRHLPAGTLSSRQVWLFFATMSVGFIASCTLFLPNWLPIAFALPVLGWICGYSLAKRFTSAAHLWLGVALAMTPICAWVAIRGEAVVKDPFELLPSCLLSLAIAFWVAGFDIIYACQDVTVDRRLGLHSIPARFGVAGALKIAAGLHCMMLVILACLPSVTPQLSLGAIYYTSLVFVGLLVVRQHTLVSPGNLDRVGIAFLNINAIISLGFCSMAAVDSVLR